ncbi:hypothetical protein ACLEW5_01185 [Citrobacter braakii]|uniref:hypothetical protein n=1 Tax=Citrobacter braakii TaxID=57706 RepID=UPI0039770817
MCAKKTSEPLQHAIVFSTEWAKTAALKYLCGYSGAANNIHVESVDDISALFSRLNETHYYVPDVIVLDIPARDYVGLLCYIRRLHPALPVIIVQPRILFSDRAVASWFGNIWLREYDSLMAGYPEMLINACVTDSGFAGAHSSAACATGCPGNATDAQVLGCMEQWLCGCLTDRLGSERCARVVTGWLSRGMSPQEVGNWLQRSDKLVYHYRWQVIRALNITGHPRDFIPSLSLKVGHVARGYPIACRMRAVSLTRHGRG